MNWNGLPYEQAAERQTGIEGWCCKTCHRFWGDDEHMARWCCAKDLPCECGKRIIGSWTKCQTCRDAADDAKWLARPEAAWDGSFPLAIWDDDKFFWEVDELWDWLADHDDADFDPLDLKWTTAVPSKIRTVELADIVSDYLDEDDQTDFSEIDKIINDWIAANVTTLYHATGKRISRASLIGHLDLENEWLKIVAERKAVK